MRDPRVRVLIALGGNALLRHGQAPRAELQRENLRAAAEPLAQIAEQHEVVLTHGNGPQIGWLALQAEVAAEREGSAEPLDVLSAQSEALIGYLIEQELQARLPAREFATLLTQVEVDPGDSAFSQPSKPIGPRYSQEQARALQRERGWSLAPVEGEWRRVVPSPAPLRVRERSAIARLVESGIVVICAGGGGIPVVSGADGSLQGVPAVIDKDRTSALLATELGCDALLLLTDVPAVFADWPEPARDPIRHATPETLRARSLAPGSMGPKVEAACQFAERAGRFAAIGALERAGDVLEGRSGTRIEAPRSPLHADPAGA